LEIIKKYTVLVAIKIIIDANIVGVIPRFEGTIFLEELRKETGGR
jgi:hypothetical protein